MTEVGRVALAARVFTVAALTSLAAVAGQRYLEGTLLVFLTAAVATGGPRMSQRVPGVRGGPSSRAGWSLYLTVFAYPDQATVAPYLVIPALIARRGPRPGRVGTRDRHRSTALPAGGGGPSFEQRVGPRVRGKCPGRG